MDRTASQRAGLAQGPRWQSGFSCWRSASAAPWSFCAASTCKAGPQARLGFLLLPLALLLRVITGGGALTLLIVLAVGA
jgi:hypothetical protein